MDLEGLFRRAFDGFGSGPEPAGFPGFSGTGNATGNDQTIDITCVSRCSRISRSGKGGLGSDRNSDPEKLADFVGDDRAREAPFKSPGNTGTPGNEAKILAETTLSQFPVKDREPGIPGTGYEACGHPFLDLNRAAPQRSDWWTGPLMAEVDRAAASQSDTTLPISPEQVRAGIERELRPLADLGRDGPDALRDAISITRAKIRNSDVLLEHQAHDGRCHVCGEPLDDTLPVISVLTSRPGAHLHLHSGCHAEHVRRRSALVDRIMTAAGYGAHAIGAEPMNHHDQENIDA